MNCLKNKSEHVIPLFKIFCFSPLPSGKCPSYLIWSYLTSPWTVLFLLLLLDFHSLLLCVLHYNKFRLLIYFLHSIAASHLHEFAAWFPLLSVPWPWLPSEVLPLFFFLGLTKSSGIQSLSFLLPLNLYHDIHGSGISLIRQCSLPPEGNLLENKYYILFILIFTEPLARGGHLVTMRWITE